MARRLLACLCLLLPAPALAAPGGASVNAVVRATVLKPLALTGKRDLDLGTIILQPGSWSGTTVTISPGGVRSCSANLTCTGPATSAAYNVSGSNRQVVLIRAPAVTLTNRVNPAQTLTLSLLAPASVTIPNSGNPGFDFAVGGTVTLNSTTPVGEYAGMLEVTVDYP